MLRRACASLFTLWLLTGCGAAVQVPKSGPESAPGPKELTAKDIRGVIDAVVQLRGLAEKTPVVVRVVSEGDFNRAFAVRRAAIEEERAGDGATGSLLPAAPKENPDVYLAFYDELTRVVYMRKEVPAWAAKNTDIRTLLAHEVTHALQDQHYSLLALRREKDREKVSAFRALIEGDAEVVRLAYDATMHHKPFRRAVAREISEDGLAPETMVKMGFFSPALLAVPPQQREMSVFPYIAGKNFVARIFLAGGFPAVDALYTHLPTTTEHILHPERFLAGEMPVTLPDIDAPTGFQVLTRISFGELGTRLVLSRLAGRPTAVTVAAGWGGDRVMMARGPMGETLLTWVSEWDDDAQKLAFSRALQKPGGGAGSPSSLRRETVRIEGTRVVFVSGIPEAEATPLVDALLALPAKRVAPSPPLGRLALVAPPLPLEQRMSSIPSLENDGNGGASFKVSSLGLSGRFRAPLIYRKGLRGGFVAASESGTMLFAQATVIANEPGGYDIVHQASVTGFASVLGKEAPKLLSKDADLGAFSKAHPGLSVRRWRVTDGAPLTFQSVVVPICGGTAALVIASANRNVEGAEQVSQFLADLSIEPRSPFCTAAQEEDRTDLPTPAFSPPPPPR